jgi:DNA-binding NtrC family response regulator
LSSIPENVLSSVGVQLSGVISGVGLEALINSEATAQFVLAKSYAADQSTSQTAHLESDEDASESFVRYADEEVSGESDQLRQDNDEQDAEDDGGPSVSISGDTLDFNKHKEAFEREFIVKALKTFKGRINQTALHANIPKKTLLRKIEKYGIVARDYADPK